MSSPVFVDRFGRVINYFRISVTDRCNYRCIYCMPQEGISLEPHDLILRFEEIVQIVRAAAQNGINRIRLTGGEPLVRRDLPWLVQALTAIPEIKEVSLTTNGSLLGKYAQSLADAGLKRVNVSLDTLKPQKFRTITRFGSFEDVWRGILAAEEANLTPVKINAVIIRSLNEDEIPDLAKLTYEHDWQVRFIELMPFEKQVGCQSGSILGKNRYVSVNEMRGKLDSFDLEPADGIPGNGPAKVFRAKGAIGTLGFISPLGEHFCGSCNRLRLTAEGKLRPCLLNDTEISIREPLRSGEDILPVLLKAVEAKPEGHDLALGKKSFNRKMSQIGG
jgi:cyclic pyranopterin phosphate synthase